VVETPSSAGGGSGLPSEELQRVARRLDVEFGHADLLEQALRHKSAGIRNNERLEFLGDAVLGMVVANALYARYPESREERLRRL